MAEQTLDGSRDYIKWDSVGQEVAGVLIRMEPSKHAKYKGQLLIIRQETGTVFCAAPTTLADIVSDNYDKLQNEFVRIKFVSEEEVPAGKLKRFTVTFDDGEAEKTDKK